MCVHQRILASVASIIKIVNITSSVSKYNHKCQLMHFEIQSGQSAYWDLNVKSGLMVVLKENTHTTEKNFEF